MKPSQHEHLMGGDRTTGLESRAVVLDEGVSGAGAVGERAWIALGLAGEPSRQLQQQWERQCHDDWAK